MLIKMYVPVHDMRMYMPGVHAHDIYSHFCAEVDLVFQVFQIVHNNSVTCLYSFRSELSTSEQSILRTHIQFPF